MAEPKQILGIETPPMLMASEEHVRITSFVPGGLTWIDEIPQWLPPRCWYEPIEDEE